MRCAQFVCIHAYCVQSWCACEHVCAEQSEVLEAVDVTLPLQHAVHAHTAQRDAQLDYKRIGTLRVTDKSAAITLDNFTQEDFTAMRVCSS